MHGARRSPSRALGSHGAGRGDETRAASDTMDLNRICSSIHGGWGLVLAAFEGMDLEDGFEQVS
jgi:hypothetical protein